jgi:hypothetical protein
MSAGPVVVASAATVDAHLQAHTAWHSSITVTAVRRDAAPGADCTQSSHTDTYHKPYVQRLAV